MLSAALMLLTASCSSSDNDITPSDQVGITAATFGTLRRQSTSLSTLPLWMGINALMWKPMKVFCH